MTLCAMLDIHACKEEVSLQAAFGKAVRFVKKTGSSVVRVKRLLRSKLCLLLQQHSQILKSIVF